MMVPVKICSNSLLFCYRNITVYGICMDAVSMHLAQLSGDMILSEVCFNLNMLPLSPSCDGGPSRSWHFSRSGQGTGVWVERTRALSTCWALQDPHTHTHVTSPWRWHTPLKDMEKWAIMHLSYSVLIQDRINAPNTTTTTTIDRKCII